jgi:hypothetical protein
MTGRSIVACVVALLAGPPCRKDTVTGPALDCLHDMDANGEALHGDQCKSYSVVVAP